MYGIQILVAMLLVDCLRQTDLGQFSGFEQIRSAPHAEARLVTSGWYAKVRHPLYLFSTVFMLLNPVMTAQWLLLTILSLAYFIAGGIIEEKRLIQEFGDTYLKYRQQVPFMIPALRRPRRTS